MLAIPCGLIPLPFCACLYMKTGKASGDVCNASSMSERGSVAEEEEEDEEEDVSLLSSFDNYQLCLKYQQVLYTQHEFVSKHSENSCVQ